MKTFKELGYRKIQGYEDYEIMYREEGEQKGEKIYCLNMRGGTAWKGWHTAHKVKEKDLKETVDKYIGWGMVDKSNTPTTKGEKKNGSRRKEGKK